jgi:hypothetical protein
MTTIFEDIQTMAQHLEEVNRTLSFLAEYRDTQTAQVAKWLRVGKSGLELDKEMIELTLIKPYTVIPISQNEAWLIQWAGIKMPVLGYVVGKDGPFIKSKVSRSMDLITPFPQYIKDEMGWKAPEHSATIDSTYTGVRLTGGDEGSFRKRYGQFLSGKQKGSEDVYNIRPGDAWIKLVSALIGDGILPYTPKPVGSEYWDSNAKFSEKLLEILKKVNWKKDRPYIERAVAEWKRTGAMLFNIPPSGGKSLIFYIILTHFKGKVLLFADTRPLTDKWKRDLELICPNADVTVSTYQGASKYKDGDWDLILFDEAHRIPADSFSKIAFFKTSFRAGATGTAWREDKRQHLIVALCGKPFYIPWEELIRAGVIKKPRIFIAIVKNDAAKLSFTKTLVAERKGKTLIFCDWINMGNEYGKALDVPFVHGETKNQLQVIEQSEVVVASKVADKGLSMQNLRLVIEVAFQGKSREQFGQRVGRLLHGDFAGIFYTVFTQQEMEAYRSRIYGVELELAGEVDIEYLYIGDIKEKPIADKRSRVRPKSAAPKVAKPEKQLDEIGKILANESVQAKIKAAELKGYKIVSSYLKQIMRYLWKLNLSHEELVDALAITGDTASRTLKAGCESLVKQKLLISDKGKYRVDHEYLDRLVILSNTLRNK